MQPDVINILPELYTEEIEHIQVDRTNLCIFGVINK